jgi:phosphoribosylformylglycinamidine synthase
VILLGENTGELGGSEYLATMHATVAGMPPALNLEREAALQKLVIMLIRDARIESAHDCSEGGLAVALAESTFDTGGLGVTVDLPAAGGDAFAVNATLFGESASRIVVSARAEQAASVLAAAKAAGVPASEIGRVGGDHITLSVNGQVAVHQAVTEAENAWATAIEKKMHRG